jgi:succinyl-CoA synthetase beta subunit
MYLLEHDGKHLLADAGIPVPRGVLVTPASPIPSEPDGAESRWVAKAQVAAGGRGKAGGVKIADTWAAAAHVAKEMLGSTLNAHIVHAVRIEEFVTAEREAYVAFFIAAEVGQVRVVLGQRGGIDIETAEGTDAPIDALAEPEVAALHAAIAQLLPRLSVTVRPAIEAAARQLANVFLERELSLLEINPLLLRADGSWVAGDAKIVTDDNALERQSALRSLLADRQQAYLEAALKFEHGFDYVVGDPDGEVGLLTTGAGLSMMLMDEMRANGMTPYNFLDMRTGGMRGDPGRLVKVLQWIKQGPRVRVVFCNIFAGATDLKEFTRLLILALEMVPDLRMPVVTRLVGNGLPEARGQLAAAGIATTEDLDEALALVAQRLEETR